MPNHSGRSNGISRGQAGWSTAGEPFWRQWQVAQRSPVAGIDMPTMVGTEDDVRAAEAAYGVTNGAPDGASDETYALSSAGAHTHAIPSDVPPLSDYEELMASYVEPTLVVPESADSLAFEMGGDVQAEPRSIVPEDPMIPHDSDTTAIRHFRHMLENTVDLAERVRTEYTQLLTSLTQSARDEWRVNGGPPPRRRERERAVPSFGIGDNPVRRSSRTSARAEESSQTFFGNIPETSTMTTVASNFGMRVNYPSIEKHPLIVGTSLAGVEIELENLAIEHPTFRYWTAKGDGSLRNSGMEFVCSHPWGGVDLYNAAVEIDGFLFGNNPDDTWRCSTHVHVDVRDMTAAQVKKMILAYVFFERVLFKCSGWHRYKNNFCVALGFAQGQLEDLGNWWAESDSTFLGNLAGRWDKYTAINFLPIGSFGSIEFRLGEAKWHKGQLIRLANRFLSLKEVAVANSDMTDEQFVSMLSEADPASIIKKGIPKGIGNLQDDLEVGFKLCHDILSLAKLRRRSRRLFMPNIGDGTRQFNNEQYFTNGWNHCRSHLAPLYPNLEFPERPGTTFNFSWLYELHYMMRQHRLTFDTAWFIPEQNRSQLTRLFDAYRTARSNGDIPEEDSVPQPAPSAPRRRPQPESLFEDDEEEPQVEW